jgi:2-amino-4-hydroxy-6-hydroxymethyldihydropteridine diphosphokinase
VVFFWLPRDTPFLVPLLALTFGIGGMTRTAKMVAWRISATELFPTRLRAAVQGWAALIGAVSGIAAQVATAALVPVAGGLAPAASIVALLGIPAAIAFLIWVPETRGVELESASLDDRAVEACVALGSNLGDRAARLEQALKALAATPGVAVLGTSALYETAPVGGPPGQGAYLNAAARVRTTLDPRALLARLLEIEREAGRVRGPERDAPRELDLDLLLYGDRCLDEPGLVVPHPRLHERAFVLAPLADVAGELVHPRLGETIEALFARVRDAGVRLFTR